MKNIYSVIQVNSYIKNMFAQDIMLGLVYVRGEVSNLKYHSSGHIYFVLKDEKSSLACIMFAGNRKNLKFTMKEGQQVIVAGKVEVYERDGKYQLYASEIKPDGQGSLNEEFERLKQKLEDMGLFAPEYKQPIPKYIKRLGVVTAPTGAAVQDIINITKRRNPYVEIILYPALVQGEHAAESIARGIEALDQYGVDVMIVGRGGGSIEDLWAFNEEIVAHAIFNCMTPIISAVGHETNFTIADFVSDLRAPTPSAAAELAVYEAKQLLDTIDGYQKRMDYLLHSKLELKKSQLERYRLKWEHLSPDQILNERRTYLLTLEERMENLMEKKIRDRQHELQLWIEKFKALSPLNKLGRGYGYLENVEGKVIASVEHVTLGDSIRITLSDGKIETKVTGILES